jgi:enamine deaminase RidA (YjgF/YER057c/UK114 family)
MLTFAEPAPQPTGHAGTLPPEAEAARLSSSFSLVPARLIGADEIRPSGTMRFEMTPKVHVTVTERGGRRYVSTGSPWETVVGYSRAVRTGELISVTGTVGIEADGKLALGVKAQARRALDIILAAIDALGGKASDVVRTRIYVTDISKWKEVGEVHGEVFGQIRPATTMVEVSRLIDDAALIEIEADAVVEREG